MKLYNRYILKKILTGFFGFAAIFILLIWFSRAISFVKYITDNGIELKQFFYLFVLILPWLLLFIIPISLFASILLIYNRLISSNEITILKNSGLTKFEIAKPVAIIATTCSILCFYISFFLMPYSNKELRTSKTNFSNNYANLKINAQSFENLKNLTIYFQNRDQNNNLSGILLNDNHIESSLTITAQSGNIVVKNNSALLYMKNGTVQRLNKLENKSDILNFDNYVFNLTENNKTETQKRWKPKERFLNELIDPNDDSEYEDLIEYSSELHQRLTYPLLPIIFSIIALSCILRDNFNRRGNTSNVVLAISLAVTFLILNISSYKLIETKPLLSPILYCNIALFSLTGLHLLNRKTKSNRNAKKD
ncbi:MAG: YjgP/YjgQ family permease [Pelagibacterales bacterium]|nr:YjgP/YjgQ family permease [Pelagibacterales bacterium]